MSVSSWPHPFHPAEVDATGAVVADEAVTVEVFQHRPDLTDQLVAWSGGELLVVNGGPVVLLPGSRRAAQRLVGLGDYAVRDGDTVTAEEAAGFYQRFVAAET